MTGRTTATSETAAQKAHRVLRGQIVDGTHRGGSMLSENTLAAALGMSRTPVRAALLRLEDEGFVTVYPKRGALVRSFTRHDADEVVAARHLLETGGVRAASPAARADLCTRLDAIVDAQEVALREDDRDGFVELSLAFHRALVEVGGNSLLLEFAERLRNRQAVLLHLSLSTVEERAQDVVDEHRALVDACRRGELEQFSERLHRHMTDAPRAGLS